MRPRTTRRPKRQVPARILVRPGTKVGRASHPCLHECSLPRASRRGSPVFWGVDLRGRWCHGRPKISAKPRKPFFGKENHKNAIVPSIFSCKARGRRGSKNHCRVCGRAVLSRDDKRCCVLQNHYRARGGAVLSREHKVAVSPAVGGSCPDINLRRAADARASLSQKERNVGPKSSPSLCSSA